MTSGPGRVGRVSRQRCGQTGMWQWSPCDRLSEPPESHQPALAPCHPTWLQTEGKLWILNLAHKLHCFLPRCCTVHPLWLLNSVGFYICELHWRGGWLSNSVALHLKFQLNVVKGWFSSSGFTGFTSRKCIPAGRTSEADKSYKRRRCKAVKWHNCHFITGDVSAACDHLPWWECLLECVCLPKTALWPPFSVSLSDRWHLEQFSRCMCHLYPWQGQSMLHDLQNSELEKRY